MKTKLVLWGTNAQEEKILIALELVSEESKVKVYTFPEESVTEEFNKLMLDEWRDGKAVEFPDGYSIEERPLSISSRLLPDGLKVEREDVVVRAQTEWHFIILSSKLNDAYKSELEDFKERIAKLSNFDSSLWEELKAFWSKVQTQVRDRNLFKEHADTLRDKTNGLFSELKGLRSKMDEEFKKVSEMNRQSFMEQLNGIEEKIGKGMRLQSIFDELKGLQRKFRDTKFTREHRSKVWERLDSAFKTVKEKRFGPGANQDRSPSERLQRRYNGLLAAIEKMDKSIKRDEDDLKFQQRKIERTDGQLEAQIRQAKIKMIEERIRSKNEKLKEMKSTQTELEGRLESLKKKEAERAQKQKEEEAKKAAQEKIAEEIKQATKASYEEQSEKLEKAAAALTDKKEESTEEEAAPKAEEPKAGKENMLSAASTMLGEALKDVGDTVKAVASVVEDKLKDAGSEMMEEVKEFLGKDEDPKDGNESVVDSIKDKVKETVAEVKEEIQEAVEEVKEFVTPDEEGTVVDKIKDKASEVVAEVKEEIQEVVEDVKEFVEPKSEVEESTEDPAATTEENTDKSEEE